MALSRTSTLVVGAGPYTVQRAFAYASVLGSTCDSDFGCESGHCSEGVCCDSACTEDCYSCLGAMKTQAGTGGMTGRCGAAAKGKNPRQACAAIDECGQTGLCDGAGACEVQNTKTPCGRTPSCATPTSAIGPSYCDGRGRCDQVQSVACATGYRCVSNQCPMSCVDEDDCDRANGYYCFEQSCATGPRCASDKTFAYDALGNKVQCKASETCVEGECRSPDTAGTSDCITTLDCEPGYLCDLLKHVCVPSDAAAETPEADTPDCASSESCDTAHGYVCHPTKHVCVLKSDIESISATTSTQGCSTTPLNQSSDRIGSSSLCLLLFFLRKKRHAKRNRLS